VLDKNFDKTMGFPHKSPAQEPHFLTRPGSKLAKTWFPAVPRDVDKSRQPEKIAGYS